MDLCLAILICFIFIVRVVTGIAGEGEVLMVPISDIFWAMSLRI